eukprot:NODE_6061_length_293_cov_10.090164_g5449_i0.p2 GENE.NODE_6061_length_293_cov_10.090164_g5449_i0~~NODE_6061_length_293_cov_10.090164_g5449_i0.p2  ORF type:complete len:75 (-),score=8.29 NODE_6061_length_293_cov_10.090164_g5449_i0:41-265(-)
MGGRTGVADVYTAPPKKKAPKVSKRVAVDDDSDDEAVVSKKRKKIGVDTRPVCKYGAACYRKSTEHRAEYRHPV